MMIERQDNDLYRVVTKKPRFLASSPPQPLLAQHFSTPLLPLIGREQEVETIYTYLEQEDVRLLTLTGPGGVGKTRLALKILTEVSSLFIDGVCFVSLTPIRAPNLVLPTIAQTLGLNPTRNNHVLVQVQEAIRDKHFLLLLDNFEHVVETAPQLKELLEACPHLKILVTSRTALRLLEERGFYLAPLALPDLAHLPSCKDLSQIAAVSLFLQRAYTSSPDFALTNDNADVIAQICVRLDGLPLALELAAARLQLFSPQGLLTKLDHSLSILTGGVRDAPERQQTLRKTLEWSHRLLTPEEQRLFRHLAVFVNGCSLTAIEALSEAAGKYNEPILDTVTALLNQSLLQREPQRDSEEQRFTMLKTIREYALECLQNSDEEEMIRQAHAEHYQVMAKKLELMTTEEDPRSMSVRIEGEFENLRTAFDWLILSKDAERALEMSVALWPFWLKNTIAEGLRWVKLALECCQQSATKVQADTRAQAMRTAAMLEYFRSNWDQADLLADKSMQTFQALGNTGGVARVFLVKGVGALLRGQYAVANAMAGDCIKTLQSTQGTWRSIEAILVLAYSCYFQGDYLQAYTFGKQGYTLSMQTKNLYTKVRVVHALALFAKAQGNDADALAMYEECLTITEAAVEAGASSPIASCLVSMGAVVVLQNHFTWAVYLWSKANTLYKRRDAISEFEPYEWLTTTLTTHLFYSQVINIVRTQLGEKAFMDAWHKGQNMTLQQLLVRPETEKLPAAPASSEKTPMANVDGLTPREREVLLLLAQGLSSALIAKQLVVSLTTVNSHVRTIYSKLGVSSRSAATRYAIEHNLM